MLLNKDNIGSLKVDGISLPSAESFNFPEKVIQFGTGVLLRGLPDYIVHLANQQGDFRGRILVVQSTGSGAVDSFAKQDNLYTLAVNGVEAGTIKDEYVLINSISRVCAAATQWQKILKSAENPELEVLISNTTEVGIVSSPDSVDENPPTSFPGKVCAFLFHRYQYFDGAPNKGMVILPTELIDNNGSMLKKFVLEVAERSELPEAFIQWLVMANDFCDTLVDRIVPGKLNASQQVVAEARLGYEDPLMIMAEPYYLWAISAKNQRTLDRLSFARSNKSVHLVPSIKKFKEIKLRLLNGTHTFSCAAAIIAGFATVKEAMENTSFNRFVSSLMDEIISCMDDPELEKSELKEFASQVIDRFANPFLAHRWESISLNYTSKMRMRNVPLLIKSKILSNCPLSSMTLGFAAYVLFMRSHELDGQFIQNAYGSSIVLQDDQAAKLYEYNQQGHEGLVKLLEDKELWGSSLMEIPGFAEQVQKDKQAIVQKGFLKAFEEK
ncbi:tagaturonate reductase [Sphingobacterium sp. DK4209]|uniref:Tagaturonate reductase n=1 Tax=Sphingobacterium zhuxiongii TaxID=2662364 RepID=A0A5Q0QCI4_9SPHI|nr:MULTISPECIES: tagaturonate reductase [unclassified Sphingobacterium]MVZ64676.1 tagaturonate reductase [Sphingobacterium sp. DK4209]QGA27014.1 tagaturonate reductase [Sphingobacterium sp. dk4302]